MKLQKRARPRFAYWRFDHGLTLRATADRLEQIAGYRIVSHEKVRTLCLPWGDPEQSLPDADLLAVIAQLTGGEISGADFRPPLTTAA